MLSKVALKSKYLQYRGSYVVYLVMKLMSKLLKALFAVCDYVIIPTVWGAKFLLPKGPSFAESRYLTLALGIVEPQWSDYFDFWVTKSKVFVDVGAASDGYYTIRACKLNPTIRVVAVEPLLTEYKYLLVNIKINSCSNEVIPINVALGKRAGVIEISRQKVTCIALDDLVLRLGLPSIDVIKIDVEGCGAEVIEGGLKTILSSKPIIFFEIHNIFEKQAIQSLRKYGYKVIERHGGMYILLPSIQERSKLS